MNKTWSNEQLAILDREYPTADLKELAQSLGKTKSAVRAKAKCRRLKRSSDVKVWNPKKQEKLIALYPNHTNQEIASLLGSTESAVGGRAFKLKLRKSPEFMLEHSSKGFFPKGHQPANKGRKQTEYMSIAQIEKTKKTRFKKGDIPKNHKPIGYERITKDGYIEVKTTEPNVFELKHRLIWTKHNGAIPTDCVIRFRDGNKLNVDISNLYLVSKSENMISNTIHRYPPELKKAIRAYGKLKKTIKKYEE